MPLGTLCDATRRLVDANTYRPLYNAELAPPEVRGFLVALQQLTTTVGIFLAYWIAYGTSHIDGGSSQWAWRIPLLVQGIPAIILAVGVWFLRFSPRLLMNKRREEEALKTLANLRGLPDDHELVQVELLESKAEVLFERKPFAKQFPDVKIDSIFRREIAQYVTIFRNKDSFKRVALGSLVMFFQQWSGIDSNKLIPPLASHHKLSTDPTTSHLLCSHHLSESGSHQYKHQSAGHWHHRSHQCCRHDTGDHGIRPIRSQDTGHIQQYRDVHLPTVCRHHRCSRINRYRIWLLRLTLYRHAAMIGPAM